MSRRIRKEVLVSAPVADVWDAWTTSAGATGFFAPQAVIELRIGGLYEILFDPDKPPGQRGAEGLRILSFLPGEMLSFEWNAPPQFPSIRGEKTWVVVQLTPVNDAGTRVQLTHLGWQEGEEWDQVFAYFMRAWDIVLGRLTHLFEVGPIDWSSPYRPPGS